MTNTCWHSRLSMKRLSLKCLSAKCRSLKHFLPCFEPSEPSAPATECKHPPQYIPTHAVASFLKTTTPSVKQQTEFLDQLSIICYCPSQTGISHGAIDEKADPFLDPITAPFKVPHQTGKRTRPCTSPRDHARAHPAALPDPDTFHTKFAGQAAFTRAPESRRGDPARRDSIELHRRRLGNHPTVWSEA